MRWLMYFLVGLTIGMWATQIVKGGTLYSSLNTTGYLREYGWPFPHSSEYHWNERTFITAHIWDTSSPWAEALTVTYYGTWRDDQFNTSTGFIIDASLRVELPYEIVTPFTIPGLPVDFEVLAISPNRQWVTDGARLYHIPEPGSNVIMALGALMILGGLIWKEKRYG